MGIYCVCNLLQYSFLLFCRKPSAPDESSTPLVRSSERLLAKRRGLQADSLETLYFTPISTRQINRYVTQFHIIATFFSEVFLFTLSESGGCCKVTLNS